MNHQTDVTVARQATFDTDPDRAKIKKGTLKLPVIHADNEKPLLSDTKENSSENNKSDSKSKKTKSDENSHNVSSKDKRGKDSVNNHRKSDASNVSANSDSKDKGLSEKQKKLNALNEAHKTNNSKPKEAEDVKKELSQKASVLNNLNAKRSNSPVKKQSPLKVTESNNEAPGNKSVHAKKQNNDVAQKDLSVKSNKSPPKRDISPQKETVKDSKRPLGDNKIQSTSKQSPKTEKSLTKRDKSPSKEAVKDNKQPLNDNKPHQTIKSPLKRDKSPQKETVKDGKQSLNDNKSSSTKLVKDHSEKKQQERRSRSPNKNTGTNTTLGDQKTKEESSKTLNEKPKALKRDPSPNKQAKSPKKPPSPVESDSLKSLKAKRHLGQNSTVPAIDSSKGSEETQVKKRDKSPDKKLDTSHKNTNETRELTSTKQTDGKTLAISNSNALEQVSSGNSDRLFTTSKAPAETKLSDKKKPGIAKTPNDHKKLSGSVSLNDIPDEKEHDDLTSAVALLVSEGDKYSSESDDRSNIKSKHSQGKAIHTANTNTNTGEKSAVSHKINETTDKSPELKDSSGQTTDRIDHSGKSEKSNSREIVRQTYVVSPSPTKFDNISVNRPELVIEQIDIEARPKEPKMQGRESYEQVYAERNTLLKAEYTFRKRIKQLEEEANGFLQTIEDLTSENKLLRDRVDQLEDKQRHNGDESAFEKISELEKEKGQLEGRVKQLEHLANSNANANQSTDAMQREVRELKAQVIKLQTDNQTVNEENIKLKAENYENVKKLHAVEAEASSLAKSVIAADSKKVDDAENLNSESDNSDLRSKNEKLQKKVDALEHENKSLSETLAQKKNELKEIMTVMKDEDKFDNDIKDLKNQVLKLQQEKDEMDRAHLEEVRIVTGELNTTKARLDDTSKEIYELKIKFDEVETENQSLKDKIVSLTKIKQSQEIEIERLKAEIERLKEALRESNDRYDQTMKDSKSKSSELRTAKENAEDLNRDLQNIIADKETQISRLIRQVDNSNKEKDLAIQSLKKEKEQLSNENNRLKVFESNMGRMELELKQMVSKYEETELKNKQHSIQLQDKGFEISNLEQQVFELNMKLDNSSKRISQLDKDNRDLEEDRREWEVKKEKVNDIEASNKRLIDENRRLRGQLEMTSHSLDYKPPEPERERPVVEAWTSDVSSKPSQHALYVTKEKKKVTIAPHPTLTKKQAPFSKSKPVRSSKSTSNKKEEPKNSVRSSRSLEDLRRTPDGKTPDSEASLPDIKRDTRLTSYGGFGQYGYAQIHKNRMRSQHKKVY